MIDLHLHLLPGIDDGARDLEQAVAMCRLAERGGCEAVVATPHQRRDDWPAVDRNRLVALRDELERASGGRPRIHLGGEIRVDSTLLAELAQGGEHAPLALAGSRYLLLELEPSGLGPDPAAVVHELVCEGWRPIIAHPELTPAVAGDLDLLAHLVEEGAHLQVTAMSVTGEFGPLPRERALALVGTGLADFVASDAHRPDWRPPGLDRARKVLARHFSAEVAERLTRDNPQAVLEDRPLPAPAENDELA